MKNNSQNDGSKLKWEKESKTLTIVDGNGNLAFEGNVVISGKFHGKLIVRGTLGIGKDAVVNGEIVTDYLFLSGTYSGTAFVKKKSTFYSGSVFSGFLVADDPIFEEGCLFRGGRRVSAQSTKDIAKPDKDKKSNDDDDEKTSLKNLFSD